MAGDKPAERKPDPPRVTMERLVIQKVLYEELPRAEVSVGEERPPNVGVMLQVSSTVQLNTPQSKAVVTLAFDVTPDPKWQPYKLQVTIAAAFAALNMSLDDFTMFCKLGVAPILFPFVREMIHHVTMDASYGSVKLDLVNFAEMAANADWASAKPSTESAPPSEQ